MEILSSLLLTILSFIIVLSIVVFVHEFGHYLIAVLNGVKVDEFAIGYGKELYGKVDKKGTKWKICYFPMGGFCKFFGDEDGSSSIVNMDKLNGLSAEEKSKCLYFKNVWQRLAVVLAGPFFNYLLSIVCLCCLFLFYGKSTATTKITAVEKGSPADLAGIQANDVILEIDGDKMKEFVDIQNKIMFSINTQLEIKLLRNNSDIITVEVEPEIIEKVDKHNTTVKIGRIGIMSNNFTYEKLSVFASFIEAVKKTYFISKSNLVALGQILTGKRGLEGMGGPIKIAQYSKDAVTGGFATFMTFIAVISSSLGTMNLLPIPVLDGGHAFLYLLEIISGGKKLNDKLEEILYKIGFAILFTLMCFVIVKDIFGLF